MEIDDLKHLWRGMADVTKLYFTNGMSALTTALTTLNNECQPHDNRDQGLQLHCKACSLRNWACGYLPLGATHNQALLLGATSRSLAQGNSNWDALDKLPLPTKGSRANSKWSQTHSWLHTARAAYKSSLRRLRPGTLWRNG